jgi:hypothetical protein
MTLDELEWQIAGVDEWVLGVKARGIVRKPVATVWADGERWRWITDTAMGSAPDRTSAIEAAEKAVAEGR